MITCCSFRSSSLVVSYIWQFVVIILFAMLLLLLYFISSFEISKSVFRPFSKLRADLFEILEINGNNPADDMGTEQDLALIANNLVNIKARYDAMQKTENLYSETKRNDLVYKIITGAYNYDERELADYNIRLTSPYNTMVLVRLDKTKTIGRSNIGLVLYGIANSGIELFTQNNMTAYATTYSDEFDVVFLVNHSGKFNTKYLEMLQKYASNAFGITVSVSYDTADNSLDSVSQIYSNVKYAMQYRIVRGHNSIICYNSLLSDISDKYEYPAKWEKVLTREINLKNNDGVKAAVDGFINEIRSMPYTYIVIHASVLAMSIMSHITKEKTEDERSDTISDELMHVETIDEIRIILLAKCDDAMISASDVGITDKHQMIANSIEEYINKNYTDPNLSIDTIASFVNKSANYTRNIFKQHKDISISEYISKKRFEEVKRMLIETNLTAQTIAQKVGMNPGSYFYTAFKKYTGFTPDQYRKKYLS